MKRMLVIDPGDSVAVALAQLEPGEELSFEGRTLRVRDRIPPGHKLGLRDHESGEAVIKYGWPIGRATAPIRAGEHVHLQNLGTSLSPDFTLTYQPAASPAVDGIDGTWRGYRRGDGRAASRNELWIIPTVGCVARTAQALALEFRQHLGDFPHLDGVHAFGHPLGCSQLDDDLANTQRILAGLATHPNAGGALILSLGCENNHLGAFEPFLGDADRSRIRFVSAQASDDEHAEGLRCLSELAQLANADRREELPVSELVVGLKCGGSDGLSGITANPLLGRFTSRLCESGGSALLTEVPEMFGAEAALFGRSVDPEVFERAVNLVRGFRDYYRRHGQPVSENPSPGNQAGGITTLEEKSLGCVQKGGVAPIRDVLGYAQRVRTKGLSLLEAPGNDPISTTALAAAGATVLLFTTGRGTPLGSPVPTLKVSTNSALFQKKPGWIDFDAGVLVNGVDRAAVDASFLSSVLDVASGERSKNELSDQRDIAIFKDGVTL